MEEIRNKVKDSGLIQLDLADFKPRVEIAGIDLAERLWQGLILREKDFREWIRENDWDHYIGKAVYIHCSADAIIPTWAFMLVGSQLVGKADHITVGSRHDLERELISKGIHELDLTTFTDGRIIIKGCSDVASPDFAMTELLKVLQPVAKSIMYGEPCSTVPLFKRK
ncbi:MAG: DUF2480 family protein [Bacteroidota bacterium]|jgi:hypothetical protein